MQPILQTERLILEPFKDSDVQDIFNYASNVEVASTTAWHAHKTLKKDTWRRLRGTIRI